MLSSLLASLIFIQTHQFTRSLTGALLNKGYSPRRLQFNHVVEEAAAANVLLLLTTNTNIMITIIFINNPKSIRRWSAGEEEEKRWRGTKSEKDC
jgi:hypothetical protein